MSANTGRIPALLRNATLPKLPQTIRRPSYDRGRLLPGLVHIGVGGFNRSHLAVYLDDLLMRDDQKRWGEFGVGLLPADKQLNAALTEQDFLYGLMLVETGEESYRIVGSLTGHLYAPETTEAVLEKLTCPDCKIVSLTVTEGGYFIEDSSGRFLSDHESIRHDLEHSSSPRTWLGYVAEAADRRMKTGAGPFTLLSCDNLQANGAAARKALLSFAELRSDPLRKWIETNVSFPNSMVDRITPRTTDENRATITEKFGVVDLAPVVSEPFRQWVLEDEFIAGRPAWDLVGAQMTTDVAPYEMMKMRLLNGGHSTIGYVADLLGFSTIAEAASDPLLKKLLVQFMAEVRPTVKQLPGIDLEQYAATIVKRFSNTAIHDQVARICSDGCAKMAKFILPSMVDLLQSGKTPQVLPFILASWLHYLRGRDEKGRQMTISDPLLGALKPFQEAGGSDARLALSTPSLFGQLASSHPQLVTQVQTALDALRSHGVRAAIQQTIQQVEKVQVA